MTVIWLFVKQAHKAIFSPNPFKNLEIISLVLLRLISSVLNVLEAF